MYITFYSEHQTMRMGFFLSTLTLSDNNSLEKIRNQIRVEITNRSAIPDNKNNLIFVYTIY